MKTGITEMQVAKASEIPDAPVIRRTAMMQTSGCDKETATTDSDEACNLLILRTLKLQTDIIFLLLRLD